jgi:PIN domain nuclease of toxin-antitoxin system
VKLRTEGARYVLDSSALIALVRRERGWEKVDAALERSVICAVNLAESFSKLVHKGGDQRLVARLLQDLALEVLPFDEELAWASRDLCSLAWTHGVSFADRAWLALARHLRLHAMTSDEAWKKLSIGASVTLLRESKPMSLTTDSCFRGVDRVIGGGGGSWAAGGG